MTDETNEAAILAESALIEGWSGPQEDDAWKGLNILPDLRKAAVM